MIVIPIFLSIIITTWQYWNGSRFIIFGRQTLFIFYMAPCSLIRDRLSRDSRKPIDMNISSFCVTIYPSHFGIFWLCRNLSFFTYIHLLFKTNPLILFTIHSSLFKKILDLIWIRHSQQYFSIVTFCIGAIDLFYLQNHLLYFCHYVLVQTASFSKHNILQSVT